MALIVQKYGGTSVGSSERIRGVADRIVRYREAGHQVCVVSSAMSGETNRLDALGKEMVARPMARDHSGDAGRLRGSRPVRAVQPDLAEGRRLRSHG